MGKMTGHISLAVAAVIAFAGCTLADPIHASCTIQWTFGTTCDDVKMKIKSQIATWSTADNCKNGGEKCLYSLVSESGNVIKAKHETPVKHYLDDLTFTLTPSGSNCNVKGYSTSETWYAYLDESTNYCNLHNLIEGAGLDQTTGYKEVTSDS